MRTALLLAFLLCFDALHAQNAETAIRTFFEKYPQEKVIILFSKPQYIAGETVFFKAHAVMGYEPSTISTNLYTELYNSAKTIVDKQIIPLMNGSGEGSFVLPASLPEDVYFVRAYTQYSLNFSEDLACVKAFPVYNTSSARRLSQKPVSWQAVVAPEGGQLLAGVAAQVAVRLTSATHLPQHFGASLIDKATGQTITEAQVFNNEIGSFYFIPATATNLVVRVTDNKGIIQEVPVPAPAATGTSLSIRAVNNKLDYVLQSKGLSSGLQNYKLIATGHEQLMFSATVKKAVADITGSINTTDWPSGVVRLTLFDEKENVVNERLCFVHPAIKTSKPVVNNDTVSFAAKGSNVWRLAVDTVNWWSYTVHVTDAAQQVDNSFLSDLYLRSDFASQIHNASWYVSDEAVNEKAIALDALMASETWKRFSWDDVLANRFPTMQHLPDQYLNYTGQVTKGRTLQPLKDINLIFRSKDSSVQFIQARTDSAGRFRLTNLVFTDTVKVYFQANNRKVLERDVAIRFEPLNRFVPYKQPLPATPYELITRNPTDTIPAVVKRAVAQRSNDLLLSEKTKLLDEVIIRTTARTPIEELERKLSSPGFSYINSMVFDFVNQDQFAAFAYNNILLWLPSRVPSFVVKEVDGIKTPFIRESKAQVYLDEVPIMADALDGLPVSNVAMIKVVRGGFMGGFGAGSAVLVYTRKAGMEYKSPVSSMPSAVITGYSQQRVFLSPDYELSGSSSVPDVRDLLYWNTWPLPVAKTGQARLQFYNNDSAKAYRIIVTGFAADGTPVYLNTVLR